MPPYLFIYFFNLNFDGSEVGSLGPAGVDGLLRDRDCSSILSFSGRLVCAL